MKKLSAWAGVVPESQDEVDEMGEADEDGQDEHRLVGGPSCRLLMPESRDDTEHGKRQSESVEHRDARRSAPFSPVGSRWLWRMP